MNREWVKTSNRVAPAYVAGINEFINVAKRNLDRNGLTTCPCRHCLNSRSHSIDIIRSHLISKGIDASYVRWVYHGEEESDDEGVDNEDCEDDDFEGLRAGLHDAFGNQYFDIGNATEFHRTEQPMAEKARYEKLYEALDTPLYVGCDASSALAFVIKLMNIKVMNKWTDGSFEMLLKLLHEVLPPSNNCPQSYYETRKLLCDAGLGYELIDVCKYDCVLFYGDHKNDLTCPICNSSRYVRNKIPHKRLRYFPVGPRLKRLYASRHTARDMRWHKEVRKEEPGVLRHPADGKAWKHFDELYPEFAADSRNVKMGLASDGFNPFSNMSTTHSMWPVILMPYNMPPWSMMHKSNYLLTLLIPGPKSPGKDFDVFLRPLVDELNVLWRDGVQAYDEYSKSYFTLRAAIIWTISDFPAYAYLSGWSTMGRMACPVCLEDTRWKRIRGKQCYTGHRCFLSATHSWRKSKEFDGKPERRGAPREFSGDEILRQLDEVHNTIPGKAPNNNDRKRKRGANELNWSKKSILFELPYWSKLLIRHNLDVMHIEKNVCDNIVGTLLNDPMKSKDTVNARLDLEDHNIRRELWLRERNGKYEKPHAKYTLSKADCKEFCDFIKSVRLPDGYASIISRCVTDANTLGGMKTHDCHVLLQKILPVAILAFLDKKIRTTLIELCQFFQKLCAKTLFVSELEGMKAGIVIILCKLEQIFPMSFFTIMVHLCVHLPTQALLGGPVSPRWMFGVERRMGTYKGYVRNYARPDGSITEAYVVDEAITFLSRYLKDIETRFTRPERNWDVSTKECKMEVFNNKIRTLGAPKDGNLGIYSNVVQSYLLNNCGHELDGYINEHRELFQLTNTSAQEWDSTQNREFPTWFKNKMAILRAKGDPKATDDLYSLSQFPDDRYTIWHSCVVNGVRFRCKERDDKLKTQCSGVYTGDENGVNIYYGVLLEILELDFILGRKVFMFRCKWYNTNPKGKTMVVNHNLTSIDTSSHWYDDDPFILATQAQQVFYLDNRALGKNWMVVQKVNHRYIYDISENIDENVSNDIFQEENASELPSFHPIEAMDDNSVLVRQDVESLVLPNEVVQKLRDQKSIAIEHEDYLEDVEEYDGDDGRIFFNQETTLESDSDNDSDGLQPSVDEEDTMA